MTDVNALIAHAVQDWYEPTPEEWVEVGTTLLAPVPAPLYYGPNADQIAACCLQLAEEYRAQAATLIEQGNADAARDQQSAARAATKAAFHAREGIGRWVDDDLLVRSAQGGGVVYRVSAGGCECEAAQHGRPCWHGQLRVAWERAEGASYAQAAD